jgi:hypothetical protein
LTVSDQASATADARAAGKGAGNLLVMGRHVLVILSRKIFALRLTRAATGAHGRALTDNGPKN